MSDLIEIATDPRKSKKISPKHADFMTAASEASESTSAAFRNVIKNVGLAKGNKRVISLSVKRGGKLSGKEYSRIGIVKFSILEEFEDKHVTNSEGKEVSDYSIFGAKVTKKDRNAIRDIFKWMFPHCELTDSYCAGTNAMVAPYFEVILRTYAGIARRLNEIVSMMSKLLPEDSKHIVDLSWLSEIDDFGKFNGMLPTPMDFNVGVALKGNARNNTMQRGTQPVNLPPENNDGEGVPLAIGMQAPQQPAAQYVAPVMQPLFEAVVETPEQVQQPQPIYQPQPQPVYQSQQPVPQPQPYNAPPQPQAPVGADPASEVMNAFTNLAMRNMPQQVRQGYYQQPMMQPQQPMYQQQPMMMQNGMQPMYPQQQPMYPNQQMAPQPMMMTQQQMYPPQPMMMGQQPMMMQNGMQQPMYMQQPMMQPQYMQQPPGMMAGGYTGGRQYLPPEQAMAAPGTRAGWQGR